MEGERFMKKGVAMLLACALAFGLSACGKGEQMSEMEAIQKQLMEMEGYSCTAELTRTSNKPCSSSAPHSLSVFVVPPPV